MVCTKEQTVECILQMIEWAMDDPDSSWPRRLSGDVGLVIGLVHQ